MTPQLQAGTYIYIYPAPPSAHAYARAARPRAALCRGDYYYIIYNYTAIATHIYIYICMHIYLIYARMPHI